MGHHAAAPKILTVDFLRKYISYCRDHSPELSDDACEEIAEFYAHLRQKLYGEVEKVNNSVRTTHARAIPTPRLLEACVRLATAHAKLKLKPVEDVTCAKKLLLYTLCGAEDTIIGGTSNELDEDLSSPLANASSRAYKRPRGSNSRNTLLTSSPPNDDKTPDEIEVEIGMEDLSISARSNPVSSKRRRYTTAIDEASSQRPATTVASTDEQVKQVDSFLTYMENNSDYQDWKKDKLFKLVNKHLMKAGETGLEAPEMEDCLKRLQKRNRVMLVGDRVFLI